MASSLLESFGIQHSRSGEINQNTVIVGGPIANSLAREYMNRFPIEITNDHPGKGKGVIERASIDGRDVILIAGSDRDGTRRALEEFLRLTEVPEEPILVG